MRNRLRWHKGILLIDLTLRASEAEHHALITGALLLIVFVITHPGVDAHNDVWRLAVQQDLHVGSAKGEAILVVANITHDIPCYPGSARG